MDNKSQGRLIADVFALCFSLVMLLFVLSLAVLSLFFPLPFASVLQFVGLNNMALDVYQDVYKNSGDVKDGYRYFIESVYAENNKHIIIAFEGLIENENFDEYLMLIDQSNVERIGKDVKLLTFLNERDYCYGKYVKALSIVGDEQKALNFVINDFNVVYNIGDTVNEKTFLWYDFLFANKGVVSEQDVPKEQIEKMQSFALSCKNEVMYYLSLEHSKQDVYSYASALECAVRQVEVYSALQLLYSINIDVSLSEEYIATKLNESNTQVNAVIASANVIGG